MRFKTMEELEAYIEETSGGHVIEPLRCCVCGEYLVDSEGWTEYMTQEDYPDAEFCSEHCIKEFLISMDYLDEEEE